MIVWIDSVLKKYGAGLDDNNFIVKDGKILRVRVEVKRHRLRFCSGENFIMSGSVSEKTVCDFVESFWFWKRINKED